MTTKIPSLRFPQFAEEWEEKKLSEVVTIQGGYAFKSEKFHQGKNKVFKIGDILSTINLKNFTGAYSSEKPDDKYLVKKNDFLIALSGATFGKVGKIVDNSIGYINQRVATFRVNNAQCLEFYFQLLQSSNFKNYINSIPSASAQPNISNSDVTNFSTFIPSLAEQTQIGNFLTAVDTRLSLLKQKYELLKSYKKGIMAQIFNQELRFKDENGQEFPAWEEKTLGEIADIYQPKTISQSELTKEGFDVFGANGIIGKYKNYNHELPQIAVTCRGNTCGTVNLTTPKSWITGNAMVVNVDNNKNINKLYLYQLLRFTNFTYLITGSGQPQITSTIKKHIVSIPNFAEQTKIANFLTAIDNKINNIGQQIAQSEEWKRGLLQAMLV